MPDRPAALNPADFAALGPFSAAGIRSTELALERAQRSFDEGRVPIAGAAVHMDAQGKLTTVTVGNNCRIPPRAAGEFGHPDGYPTDHGETAAIRLVGDVTKWDWGRVVFTTTLSPCILCNRSLTYLHGLGLKRIVIAEAQTFPGTKDLLRALPGMTMVELTNPDGVRMMQAFARTYPWDWAADIGEVPPGRLDFARGLADDAARRSRLLAAVAAAHPGAMAAGLFDADGKLRASAQDERAVHGGNPVFSGPMLAMGRAGSSVNLRESVLVVAAGGSAQRFDLATFGHSSLGACELFRPAAVVGDAPFDAALRGQLEAAGVRVLAPV